MSATGKGQNYIFCEIYISENTEWILKRNYNSNVKYQKGIITIKELVFRVAFSSNNKRAKMSK